MTTPLRLLLVEDSATDAKLLERELRRGGYAVTMRRVECVRDLREALAADRWDLIISDWSLPGFSGLEALEVLRATGRDIPFILVSGTIGEERAVEAMRCGARDFVLKDNLSRLAPAVDREMRECQGRRALREAGAALKVSEARFERLAESGIIAISVGDVYGRIHEANDAFLTLFGFTREELRGGAVNWYEMSTPEERERDDLLIPRLQAEGRTPVWEKEFVRRDGSRFSVLMGVAMLEYPDCLAFHLDLTERKRAQDALRKSEEHLRQAQKLEAIGSLAGGVAHDFNNLLSVILSYSTILAMDLPAGDPLSEGLAEIRAAGERAAELTRQLLIFSRKQVIQAGPVDLNRVVSRLERMLRRLLGEDVELVVSAAEGLGIVRGDVGQMEQVLTNLVVNARDAMPGGGRIEIETANLGIDEASPAEHPGATPGEKVRLTVIDDGCGMEPAVVTRIFEPFFTTKEEGRGTGLGLSTVFGILHQCGGSIEVKSEPGKGTRFDLIFPRTDPGGPEVRPAEATSASRRGSETILLAEDDRAVRTLSRTILEALGYRVLDAAGPGDALLIAERYDGPIHLLLTDVVMPRMSGPELAKRLIGLRPDVRVLLMSGYIGKAVDGGALLADVAYIQKPITPESLAAKVRDVLDAAPAPDPPA